MSTGGTKKQGHHFKLVLLGNSAAGKTSICNRFVNDAYTEHAESTIGASFMQKSIVMEDNEQIHFDIWDTAGQERFKSLAPMYYRGSAAAIIVYDITDNNSFEAADNWVGELQRHASSNIVIYLVGNKCDLDSKRQVSTSEGTKFAETNGISFIECSAKTGKNISEMFVDLARKLPKNAPAKTRAPIEISPVVPDDDKKDCQC
eukprot:TRINITY_DN2069_c0_g1_i2.p1 TRINITY_DN2069_c0_g1~~TRINITY_DN2069_c0_g1_i2.p1  ORF type:complete len:203 (+),score=29.23 TRINITY_DN2069_c0_g1_i2:444-1052(+)